jgi:septum site-determining protein MinD
MVLMSRSIVFASGKGGVGKTTIAANLGVALSIYGEETVVLDADVAMANLESVLGMEGKSVNLHDVLSDEASIEDAIYEGPGGVKVVPAGISLDGLKKIRLERLEGILNSLTKKSDILIVDAPAGLGKDALAAIASAQEMILVTTPEVASMGDALKTKIIADQLGIDVIGAVINREQHDEESLSEIETFLEVPILAIIPEDPEVGRTAALGETLVIKSPNSPASQAIMHLSADLIGEEYHPLKTENKGLVAQLKGLFGIN